jgi:hypothetical protein
MYLYRTVLSSWSAVTFLLVHTRTPHSSQGYQGFQAAKRSKSLCSGRQDPPQGQALSLGLNSESGEGRVSQSHPNMPCSAHKTSETRITLWTRSKYEVDIFHPGHTQYRIGVVDISFLFSMSCPSHLSNHIQSSFIQKIVLPLAYCTVQSRSSLQRSPLHQGARATPLPLALTLCRGAGNRRREA